MVKWQTHTHTQTHARTYQQTWLEADVDVHHSVIVSQRGWMEKEGQREAQRFSTAKITALSHQISAMTVCVRVYTCVYIRLFASGRV